MCETHTSECTVNTRTYCIFAFLVCCVHTALHQENVAGDQAHMGMLWNMTDERTRENGEQGGSKDINEVRGKEENGEWVRGFKLE